MSLDTIIIVAWIIIGAVAATIRWAVVSRGKLRSDLSLNERWEVLVRPAVGTVILWPVYFLVGLSLIASILRSQRGSRQI